MKKSASQKFTEYFDQDWQNTKSNIRQKYNITRTYDPATSWEARSQNASSFAKLDVTHPHKQLTNTIVLSGKTVIPLDGGSHSTADLLMQRKDDKIIGNIPLTREQRDVGMSTDLSESITVPLHETAAFSKKAVLLEEPVKFYDMAMRSPRLRVAEKPRALVEAGPQCDQKFLNPRQRREIAEFERKERDAIQLMKTAAMDRNKTKGIVMLEKRISPDSGSDFESMKNLERTANLAVRTSSILSNGNILLPETLGKNVKVNKFYQSKGGTAGGLWFEETHHRLFYRKSEHAPNMARAQYNRDQDLSGKSYDIISHALISEWPSKNMERQCDRRLEHASQTSLERGRNLQGTMTNSRIG